MRIDTAFKIRLVFKDVCVKFYSKMEHIFKAFACHLFTRVLII
jgi:hypothetical protein